MKTIILTIALVLSQIAMSQTQTGKASYYADSFEGRPTASGEIYKHDKATAAHRNLPFGTKVRVTNLQNNKSAVVTINDRGPFIRGRIIDLSKSIALSLNIEKNGVSAVSVEVVDDNNTTQQLEDTPPPPKDDQPEIVEKTSKQFEATTNNSNTTSPPKEFYELSIRKVQPSYFGVQIASYQENANLLRLVNTLNKNNKAEVIVQIKTINDNKVYTVILGQFQKRAKAEAFKTEHLDEYPGAFIVNLTKNE